MATRTSQKADKAKFAFWGFCELRLLGILGSSGSEKSPERCVYAPALKLHHASYFCTGTKIGAGHTRPPALF